MSTNDIVKKFSGGITVVEGDRAGVTFCWVERDGVRVSDYTDIDRATAIAESLDEER
jgi:hypothetical protein